MAGSQHNCQNGGHVSEAADHERARAPRNLELLRRVRLAVVIWCPCICRMHFVRGYLSRSIKTEQDPHKARYYYVHIIVVVAFILAIALGLVLAS